MITTVVEAPRMHIVQLMASPFFGGPERQMLGLALALPASYRTSFLSFSERGLCQPFLEEVRSHGFAGIELKNNFPAVRRAVNEIARHLRDLEADILCCSGYKPDVIGWLVGRQTGLPVVSVSHGWTGATRKVRFYEALDRMVLRWIDAIVCVSEGQAVKVRRTGAPGDRIRVIRNAVSLEKFGDPNPAFRNELRGFFRIPRGRIIVAAGRLSPEKGFARLVEAAALLVRSEPDLGVVIFGEGPLRGDLTRQIADLGLQDEVVLAGFHSNIEDFLPHADVVALPSYTEGLPVIALEALAARVPVVATSVGGVPEVVEDGLSGFLVPPGDAVALALRIAKVLSDESLRRAMGLRGRQRVQEQFTFAAQGIHYQRLFKELMNGKQSASRTSLMHASTS
jgi:glycosyltransferase involved in cell wall biosynthesis